MGELDVAVKTIHREHVNEHLTPEEALQVMRTVQGLFFAAVAHSSQPYPSFIRQRSPTACAYRFAHL